MNKADLNIVDGLFISLKILSILITYLVKIHSLPLKINKKYKNPHN